MTRLCTLTFAGVVLGVAALVPIPSHPAAHGQPTKKDGPNALKKQVEELQNTLLKRNDDLVELVNLKQKQEQQLEQAQSRIRSLEKKLEDLGIARQEVKPPPTTREVMKLLAETIETKGFTPSEGIKLKKAIDILADKFGGRVSIVIYPDSFRDPSTEPLFDPYNVDVWLPEIPSTLPLNSVLRIFASQIGVGEPTLLIREGLIEIVPASQATAKHRMAQRAFATFEQRPLRDVLAELADVSGLTITLDPSLGKKADTPISATFRNCSLEDALVAATEMADLKFVPLHSSVYVTTSSRVATIEQEEKKRSDNRPPLKQGLAPAR